MEPPDHISSKTRWYVSLGLAKIQAGKEKVTGLLKKFMVGMSV